MRCITTVKKNQTDAVSSTRYVPLRDMIACTAVMNQTIKPYLVVGGRSAVEVDKMHQAWCKSVQLQIALWSKAYVELAPAEQQW